MEQLPKCLLIDDDEDDRFIFEMAASKAAPAMLCMTEGDSVRVVTRLESDTGFTPSVIFLDLNMPGLSGRQCLERIRRVDRLARTPVYILSTSRNPRDVQDARMLGSSGYLVKPHSFDELVHALSCVMRRMGSTEFYLHGEVSP